MSPSGEDHQSRMSPSGEDHQSRMSPSGEDQVEARPPLVSVVIPIHQASAFIADALASIAVQDHPAIEVVLVDDGSTDGGAALARARAEELGLSLVAVDQANRGPAVARNLGLRHARGRYVTFLDADDRMVAGRVAFQVAHLQAAPQVDGVIGTGVNEVDPGVTPPTWLAELPRVDAPHFLVMTVMARAEVFDRVGGFDPSYAYAGEDTEWYLRARAAGVRFDLVDQLMVLRRIHGANLTYQVEDLDEAMFRLLRERARRARAEAAEPEVRP